MQMPVSVAVVIYALTGLTSLLMIFTRQRLHTPQVRTSRSNRSTASGLVTAYTATALLGLLGWILFLSFSDDSLLGDPLVGVVGLFFLWITTLIGLRFVTRRTPRGRHLAPTQEQANPGRGLVVAAQLVLLLSVSCFTWAYTTAAI